MVGMAPKEPVVLDKSECNCVRRYESGLTCSGKGQRAGFVLEFGKCSARYVEPTKVRAGSVEGGSKEGDNEGTGAVGEKTPTLWG